VVYLKNYDTINVVATRQVITTVGIAITF